MNSIFMGRKSLRLIYGYCFLFFLGYSLVDVAARTPEKVIAPSSSCWEGSITYTCPTAGLTFEVDFLLSGTDYTYSVSADGQNLNFSLCSETQSSLPTASEIATIKVSSPGRPDCGQSFRVTHGGGAIIIAVDEF